MTTNLSRNPRVAQPGVIETADRDSTSVLRSAAEAIRPNHWIKNLLLFVPAVGAHQLDWQTQLGVALAFVSFCLCASGGYVVNDLLDAAADREHPRKRLRPFAAGVLSQNSAILLVVGTWVPGVGLAALFLPPTFLAVMVLYVAATLAYSTRLKREPVLDVMFLAGLYVVRVVAGGKAVAVPVSSWLLAFMLFVFLSLAFLKRFIELRMLADVGSMKVPGRGYQTDDTGWLHCAGLSSAYLSVVVLALYANGPDVTRLYGSPERLLLLCPILLFWSTRVWLQAHRGRMHDDPVVAITRDPVTYVIGAVCAAIVWAAV